LDRKYETYINGLVDSIFRVFIILRRFFRRFGGLLSLKKGEVDEHFILQAN